MKTYNIFKTWLRKNVLFVSLFSIGVLLFLVAAIFSKYEISATMLLCFYGSALAILAALMVYFIKRNKVVFGNIILLFFLILVVEIVCFFLQGMPMAYNRDFDSPDFPENHITRNVGNIPFTDSIFNEVLILNDDTVFDVDYTVNLNSIRVTPDHNSNQKNYALFFGCSITYGYGLEDDETLPYQFQRASNKFNSYNYAFNGYGANHMLARMEFQDVSKQVKEEDGVAIYVFFWDHIYRSIGSMYHYTGWLNNAPYYTFEEKELTRKGMFNDGRLLISKSYEYLYQLSIIKQFGIDFPLGLSDEHYHLVTEIILKSKETYIEQFGNDNFYVAFYPSYTNYSKEEMDRFKSYLNKKKIATIDLTNCLTYAPEHTLGDDPHPNANTNETVAIELWKQMIDK